MKHKKGFTITEVPTLAITLGVIAIILGIVATILVEFQSSQTTDSGGRSIVSLTDTNNTFTASNLTYVNFASDHTSLSSFVPNSCSNVYFKFPTTDVTSNFTVVGCTAVLEGGGTINGSVVTANYTWQNYEYGYSWNVTQDGVNATESFANWQGTFVVVLAAAIIIGIISAYLMFRPRE